MLNEEETVELGGKKDQFAAITVKNGSDKDQQRMLNLGGNTDRVGYMHGLKVSPLQIAY